MMRWSSARARSAWPAPSKSATPRADGRVVEKGALVNSIVGYPTNMEFFSTPELIEIGGYPFPVKGYKPTREEAIEYYRGVAQREQLDVRLYERVIRSRRAQATSRSSPTRVPTRRGTSSSSPASSTAQPAERARRDLPKVTHYYREPYPYVGQKVAVIGAKNSAAKAALDCYRHGAEVTLDRAWPARAVGHDQVLDSPGPREPHQGRQHPGATSTRGRRDSRDVAVLLRTPDGDRLEIANDWVLAMTGYQPDFAIPRALGVTFADDGRGRRCTTRTTFETERPGLYLAGTVCGGMHEPVVHRERPLPRAADRPHIAGEAHRAHPPSSTIALEDRRVRPIWANATRVTLSTDFAPPSTQTAHKRRNSRFSSAFAAFSCLKVRMTA
jgi:thioredoxin reductase (NADPH)